MKIIKAHNLVCPIDGTPLSQTEKQWVCETGHSFDVARQGYVNLLLVQQKRSKSPGDSKEMVGARSHFLNSGSYESLAKKLAEMVLAQIPASGKMCILDAGCGEGYYFDYVCKLLTDARSDVELSFIGLDISKPAITESAKRNKQISWIVASNRQPPIADSSVDIILCVFGFPSFDGFSKIAAKGGKVILVDPGPDHMQELRAIIYPEVTKSTPQDFSTFEEFGFKLIHQKRLQFTTGSLDNENINNLLLMTPHFYRAKKQGKEKATQLESLESSVDIVFSVLEKYAD